MTRLTLLAAVVSAALLVGGPPTWASPGRPGAAGPGDAVGPPSNAALRDSAGLAEAVDAPSDTAAVRSPVAGRDSTASALPADRVVVYYFHRTARCDNCLKFEAYTWEALRGSFGEQLADGTLDWRVVNLDDTTNAHFVEDYDLFEISLVVSSECDGREVGRRNLDAIWTLVDDKASFLEYVSFEVGEELKRLHEPFPQDPHPVPVHRELVPEPDGRGMDASPQGRRD